MPNVKQIAILAILLAGSMVHAAPPKNPKKSQKQRERDPIPCVRIRQELYVTNANGSTTVHANFISGTVIWRHLNGGGQVLTCAHGLDERVSVRLLIAHRDLVDGQIVAIDKEKDLALINCLLPADVKPMTMSGTSPDKADEGISLAGYGEGWLDFTYAQKNTKIIAKQEHPRHKNSNLLVYDVGRNGDSGGPLISNGSLIGVHVMGDKEHGWAVPVEEVHEFLIQKAGWKRNKN